MCLQREVNSYFDTPATNSGNYKRERITKTMPLRYQSRMAGVTTSPNYFFLRTVALTAFSISAAVKP